MYLTNWIDKRFGEIQGDTIFQNFFKGIRIQEIEGTFYLDNRILGIDIVFSDALIATSVHLHAFGSDYEEYKGDMPFELLFSMARSTVKEKIGKPAKSGGGTRDIFGPVPMWDKYYFHGYSLHVQYSEGENKIDLTTIASMSLEAYFNSGLQ